MGGGEQIIAIFSANILATMKMTEADPTDLCGAPAHGENPPIKRGFASHSASFHIVRGGGVAVCTVYTLSVILTYSVYTVSSARQYIHCLKYCETVYTLYTKRRTVYMPSQVLDSVYTIRMVYTLYVWCIHCRSLHLGFNIYTCNGISPTTGPVPRY
jgi:hypothetical protein